MPEYLTNGATDQLVSFETPFGDRGVKTNLQLKNPPVAQGQSSSSIIESPFTRSYEAYDPHRKTSPLSGEYVQMLAELNDPGFSNVVYELSAELEDTWQSKISDELAMKERFAPFATQQANQYFSKLIRETDNLFDRVGQRFSDDPVVYSESEVDNFFNEMNFEQDDLSPAQEQLFGSIFKKVKSVVKKGVDLAKKGIKAVGKFLPINIILGKLKKLIKPLLERVLKYAIGKLPKRLQPYAQDLAKKYLKLDSPATDKTKSTEPDETPATGDVESIQTELDFEISQSLFSGEEDQNENLVNYERAEDSYLRELNAETGGVEYPSLAAARQQFINELKELKPGADPAPAIDNFLPAVVYALKPVIKMGISLIGRPRVISFLANILSQLIKKFVPENTAKPLSTSIVTAGLNAIGFETAEGQETDLAYEAIANTIEETVLNMDGLNSESVDNEDVLAAQLMESFETAAANNFPADYVREELKPRDQGLWILKPRKGKGPKHFYKKYSKVFPVTISPVTAKAIHIFKGNLLADFLKDKLGLDPAKPVEAKVHLYEAIDDTRLNRIARFEKVQGLGAGNSHAWIQLHPLTKEAATLLIKEPALGKDISQEYLRDRHKIAVGQRFFYLEINGAKLRIPYVNRNRQDHRTGNANTGPGHSADVLCVINFVKSEIRLNYYLSEDEAKAMVEKLNGNDATGITRTISGAIKNVFNDILIRNLEGKVKIVHEDFPELYLENLAGISGQTVKNIRNSVKGVALNAGKDLLTGLFGKLVSQLVKNTSQALLDHFKTRAGEFIHAQAEPKDGVTIKIDWLKIPGMSAIRSLISAVKGNLAINNLNSISIPEISMPEVKVVAGKNFD